MTYFLIIFVLMIIISPLMWLRQTPRQKLTIDMRKKATNLGMIVKLSATADSRKEKKRLNCVTYKLKWHPESVELSGLNIEDWTLIKSNKRGEISVWPGWRWLDGQPSHKIMNKIELVIKKLPISVSALQVRSDGLLVYWNEEGDAVDVNNIYESLLILRGTIRD